VEPLIAALKDGDQGVRRSATEALVKIGGPAVEPLIAASIDQDVRKYAARALGRIGDPRAVEPLSAALEDQNGDVRIAAAEALGHIGAPAVEPLMAAFKRQGVRRWATEALVKMGGPAVEPLIAAFIDGDQDVRKYAARALGRIGDPRARKLLRVARSDPDQSVRKVATEGLAGQALADKLRRIRVGMTEKALTGLVGRPAVAGSEAAAMGGSSMIVVAVPGEALGQESWVFETEFGDFQVVMRHGRVAETLTGGLLDRLRPAWRTRDIQRRP
jgi:HEAT repeat protein